MSRLSVHFNAQVFSCFHRCVLDSPRRSANYPPHPQVWPWRSARWFWCVLWVAMVTIIHVTCQVTQTCAALAGLGWANLFSENPPHISELVCDSLNMDCQQMCVCVYFRYFTAWSAVWRGHLPSQQDASWFCAVKTSGSSRFSSHRRGTVLISMRHCSGCHDQVCWKITAKVNLSLCNNVLQMRICFLLPW